MLFENHECIQKWNLTSYHYKSWCLGQTSSTVLQISLKAFEKLTKIGFRRAGLGHVKMLNFVFGRGASPPWTPYRGVAPGPQWGPRWPPHPRPNGPSKIFQGNPWCCELRKTKCQPMRSNVMTSDFRQYITEYSISQNILSQIFDVL